MNTAIFLSFWLFSVSQTNPLEYKPLGLLGKAKDLHSSPEVREVVKEANYMPTEILIKLKQGVKEDEIKEFSKRHNAEFVKVTRKMRVHLIRFEPVITRDKALSAYEAKDAKLLRKYLELSKEQIQKMIELYEKSGLVEYARFNHLVYAFFTPNDPFFVDCTSFPNTSAPDQYGLFRMHAQGGWDVTTGSSDVLIGYVDSGLDLDNPDIEDNVWTNPGETPNNGTDDDGNGYVDDVHGYDFIGDWNGDVWGAANEDPNPDVFHGDPACGDGEDNNMDGYADAGVAHGTMTSGTACCVIDNALAFAGGSGHCKVVMARVINPEGGGTEATIAAGLEYLDAVGVDIINCSLGASMDMESVHTACDNLNSHGTAVVCASGNDGSNTTMYPASYSSTFAVGASNSNDERSEFSTYGSWLDVVAPGGDVSGQTLTEAIWGIYVISVADSINWSGPDDPPSPGSSEYVGGGAGTSLASPYCAALAALIKSVNPGYTPRDIFDVIIDNAYDIPPSGFDEYTGHGRIDYNDALAGFGVDEIVQQSSSPTVLQIYPNPASHTFLVKYMVPRTSMVNLKVYDITGSLVKTLVDDTQDRGTHEVLWDGNGSSGIYFLTLKTGEKYITKKVTVVQ